MWMMEQHGHKNNAWCFHNKHFPALISFIPSKHYDVGRLGIYWTFIQYIFFFEQFNFLGIYCRKEQLFYLANMGFFK